MSGTAATDAADAALNWTPQPGASASVVWLGPRPYYNCSLAEGTGNIPFPNSCYNLTGNSRAGCFAPTSETAISQVFGRKDVMASSSPSFPVCACAVVGTATLFTPNQPFGGYGCADADCVGGASACTTIHPVAFALEVPFAVFNVLVLLYSAGLMSKVLVQLVLAPNVKVKCTWTVQLREGGREWLRKRRCQTRGDTPRKTNNHY
jgi:hypothetical protein